MFLNIKHYINLCHMCKLLPKGSKGQRQPPTASPSDTSDSSWRETSLPDVLTAVTAMGLTGERGLERESPLRESLLETVELEDVLNFGKILISWRK